MRRILSFILQATLFIALAVWLADRPGTARLEWHGTVIETSAAFLGVCVLILGIALHLLFRLCHFLRHGPVHWRLRRRLGKLQKGQDQLTQGLVAIAAGNATEAGRLAVAARRSLGVGTATRWLQAQAAQLAGDHNTARQIFRALANDEQAAVLGYRGLITEARRNKQWSEVDRLTAEAYRIKPATPWLSLIRMENAARRHAWGEAESALAHATAARLLDPAAGRRTRAGLRVAQSREAARVSDMALALQAAEQAAQQAPDWLPAQINLAEQLFASKHPRSAHRVIERAWVRQPHPQLAALVRAHAEDALDAFRQTERLCRSHPDAPESRLALAEAALNADIWGEARRFLLAAVNSGQATQSVYKLLARIERRERGDERAAAAWLSKAVDAKADPLWLCLSCQGTHDIWQPTCAHCGAFDRLEWQGQKRETRSGERDINLIPS